MQRETVGTLTNEATYLRLVLRRDGNTVCTCSWLK